MIGFELSFTMGPCVVLEISLCAPVPFLVCTDLSHELLIFGTLLHF